MKRTFLLALVTLLCLGMVGCQPKIHDGVVIAKHHSAASWSGFYDGTSWVTYEVPEAWTIEVRGIRDDNGKPAVITQEVTASDWATVAVGQPLVMARAATPR